MPIHRADGSLVEDSHSAAVSPAQEPVVVVERIPSIIVSVAEPLEVDAAGCLHLKPGGQTPEGNGLAKVVAGAFVAMAALLVNADVDPFAAIDGTKITAAAASVSGVITAGAQTIGGLKTFAAGVRLASGTSLLQTETGTLGAPSGETTFSIQPRDPSKPPFTSVLTYGIFNSTVDSVFSIGSNAEGVDATKHTAEWVIEQDYEVSPGVHLFEMYTQLHQPAFVNLVRPFYCAYNKGTGEANTVLSAYNGGAVNISSDGTSIAYWNINQTQLTSAFFGVRVNAVIGQGFQLLSMANVPLVKFEQNRYFDIATGCSFTQAQGGTSLTPANENLFLFQPRLANDGITRSTWSFSFVSAIFNGVYDQVGGWGYNFAGLNTEPSAGHHIEVDYNPGPGQHHIEMYWSVQAAGGLRAIRPFAVVYDMTTGVTDPTVSWQAGGNLQFLGGSAGNNTIVTWTDSGAVLTAGFTFQGTSIEILSSSGDLNLFSTLGQVTLQASAAGQGVLAFGDYWGVINHAGSAAVLVDFRRGVTKYTMAPQDNLVDLGSDSSMPYGSDNRWRTIRGLTVKSEAFTLATALTGSNWAGGAPTDLNTALNRMASLVKTLNGGTAIP